MRTLLILLRVLTSPHIYSGALLACLNLLLICVLVSVLHEAGHLVSARLLGVRVKKVGICWKGFYIRRESGAVSKNLLITLSGPLANLICVGLWHWFPSIGLYSLVLAISNLAPIKGSDGRRAITYIDTLLHPHSVELIPVNLALVVRKKELPLALSRFV